VPRVHLVAESEVRSSTRLKQLASMFDLAIPERSRVEWDFDLDLPDEWSVGLIVGPSGSGKSTVGRELFGESFFEDAPLWDAQASVVDGFPEDVGVKAIAEALSSVGFSSPPAWLRPHAVLSTGEQFRANVARRVVEAQGGVLALDEWTSVVDRTVAQIGSAAVSKWVRRRGLRFVAVTCHYDVVDWLQPDWVLEMPAGTLERRSVQRRPALDLVVERCDRSEWETFRPHHYLSHSLANSAACYVAKLDGRSVAFMAVLSFPHAVRPGWRGHRAVCLPDFQGVGIGNAIENLIGSVYSATGKPYRTTTSHPAMIRSRARSPLWRMFRPPSRVPLQSKRGSMKGWQASRNRLSASFEYVGKPDRERAVALGLVAAR